MKRNIYTSIDIKGMVEKWGDAIVRYYGATGNLIDTAEFNGKTITSLNPQVQSRLMAGAEPYTIISAENKLPDYVRLTSSKSSTIGYELLPKDITTRNGKQYLTNTYNLSIEAQNNDTIIWWGNAITPNSLIQGVVTCITSVGRRTPLPELKNPKTVNEKFSYPVLENGNYSFNTQDTFSYQGQIEGSLNQDIAYDIHLDLIVPVHGAGCVLAKFVCDPHIHIVE